MKLILHTGQEYEVFTYEILDRELAFDSLENKSDQPVLRLVFDTQDEVANLQNELSKLEVEE